MDILILFTGKQELTQSALTEIIRFEINHAITSGFLDFNLKEYDPESFNYILATYNGEIIGYIKFYQTDYKGACYWIDKSFVKEAFREQGIYKRMFAYMLENFKDLPILSGVNLDNKVMNNIKTAMKAEIVTTIYKIESK